MTDRITLENLLARMEAWKRDDLERAAAKRAALLPDLRHLGVEELFAVYEGYSDSGNVELIETTPPVALGDLEAAVTDFVWTFAYSRHPGFENNDGGQGELTWDIGNDSITLDHGTNHMEVEHSYEEGL